MAAGSINRTERRSSGSLLPSASFTTEERQRSSLRRRKNDVLSGAEVRLSHQWLVVRRYGPFLPAAEPCRLGPHDLSLFLSRHCAPWIKPEVRVPIPPLTLDCTCSTTRRIPAPARRTCPSGACPPTAASARLRGSPVGAHLSLPRGNPRFRSSGWHAISKVGTHWGVHIFAYVAYIFHAYIFYIYLHILCI